MTKKTTEKLSDGPYGERCVAKWIEDFRHKAPVASEDPKDLGGKVCLDKIIIFKDYTMGNGEHPKCHQSSVKQIKKLKALFKLANQLSDWEKAFIRSVLY